MICVARDDTVNVFTVTLFGYGITSYLSGCVVLLIGAS
jgi:hypothetical protein